MARSRQYPSSVDPGLPVEPNLPPGWLRTTFGEVLQIVQRPVVLDDGAEYQLVTARRSRGGIVPRERLKGHEILTKTQFEVRAGDFLISRRQIIHGACGVVPASLEGAVVSNEYATLRPRDGLLTSYLQYLAHTSYFQRTCFHSSVGVDVEKMIFKLDDWMRFPVQLPPLSEQRKIAVILSSVDDSIDAAQAVIDQLHVVKKAVMAELLTRGVPGRHRRYVPFTGDWRVGRVRTGVLEIPEGWALVRLSSVARLESGHTPSRRHPEYWNGDIPWVSLHDSKKLDDPEINDTVQTIGALGLENSSARLLPKGTVVFSRTATVGKACITGREMATSQDFANYVCGDQLHNRYLMHLFRNMEDEWRRLMAGSAHKTVYMPIFRKLEVLLPPLDEQQDIAAAADAFDARLEAEKGVIAGLRRLKAALMRALLTGETRVTPSQDEVAA